MSKYDNPRFDDCRKWIQKKRERGASWQELRLACKHSEEDLCAFLSSRVVEDDWPVLSEREWVELVSELEEYEDKQKNLIFRGNDGALFDINQDNGLRVPENERSCWQLYKKSLGWNPDSVQDLEDATIGILRRLSSDTREIGPIKGLVIGHVQSGKTANMEALMAMAADHGWNMFIVLSGTIESLRLQTLKRMQKDLNHEGNLIWRGIEHPSKKSQYGERAQDFHFEPNAQSRYFTVCLKNASRLKKLIDWIRADKASHDLMKILIIDDEADQASISNTAVEYKQAQKERKGINKLIVHLVEDTHYKETKTNGHVRAMNYVMYTATPYANFLNERAFDEFGFETQAKGFHEMAALFGKKGSYLRRLRDEYDVVTNSFRRGQCNRPPRPRIIQTTDYLKQFSFEELTEIVRAFFENARLDNDISEEFQQDFLLEALDEDDLENILNFKDTRASIKLRTRDQRVRVYNTSIIKQLKRLYGGCCQLCGKNAFDEFNVDISEAHHIAHFSDSQNNDSSNIIILCPNHHRLMHKLNPKFDSERGCFVFSDNSELRIEIDFHLMK